MRTGVEYFGDTPMDLLLSNHVHSITSPCPVVILFIVFVRIMMPAWLLHFILTCQAARPCGSNVMAASEIRILFVRFSRYFFDSFSLISIHELAQTLSMRPVLDLYH
jgi:hypothetical protein